MLLLAPAGLVASTHLAQLVVRPHIIMADFKQPQVARAEPTTTQILPGLTAVELVFMQTKCPVPLMVAVGLTRAAPHSLLVALAATAKVQADLLALLLV